MPIKLVFHIGNLKISIEIKFRHSKTATRLK